MPVIGGNSRISSASAAGTGRQETIHRERNGTMPAVAPPVVSRVFQQHYKLSAFCMNLRCERLTLCLDVSQPRFERSSFRQEPIVGELRIARHVSPLWVALCLRRGNRIALANA